MRDQTRTTLNIALTHLRVEQQEIETAIAAILAVLGEADLVPVERRPAPAPPRAARPRRTAPGRRSGKAEAARTTPAARAPQEAPERDEAAGRAKHGEWQAHALRALQMGDGDVQVRELATRLRISGPGRDKAIQALWGALQALVKSGAVEKRGPRYRLKASPRGEAA